jgi:hypothetical protein
MTNYFPVALTGTARSWLMNLPEGTIDSWSELCRQFTTNLASEEGEPMSCPWNIEHLHKFYA